MTLLFATCFVATAQNAVFKEGYIRLKGGEEQRGLIGAVINGSPELIQYKVNADAEIQTYSATDIEGYNVEDIFYSSYLNPGPGQRWNFVELLVEGELTLMRKNSLYFISQKGSTELVHLGNKYKSVLKNLTKNCPLIASASTVLRMNKIGLTDHIRSYNECVAIKNPNFDGMPHVISLGVMVGFDGTGSSYENGVDKDPTAFLKARRQHDKSFLQYGADLTLKSYKISNFVGLYTGAYYNSNNYAATNKARVGNTTQIDSYTLNYTELKIPIGFEFGRPAMKKLTYHVRVGAVIPVVLKLTASHPNTEIDDFTSVRSMTGANVTNLKVNAQFGGAMGFDYQVFGKSRVRVQASAYVGTVTATVRLNSADFSIKGYVTSFSLMTGFIF